MIASTASPAIQEHNSLLMDRRCSCLASFFTISHHYRSALVQCVQCAAVPILYPKKPIIACTTFAALHNFERFLKEIEEGL